MILYCFPVPRYTTDNAYNNLKNNFGNKKYFPRVASVGCRGGIFWEPKRLK